MYGQFSTAGGRDKHWHPRSPASADIVADQTTGFAGDAEVDLKGFENVLKLRAVVEAAWGGKPPVAARYLDLSFYNQAVSKPE
jgi:hypothetical protein